jgi:hypothetical protein
VQRGDVDRILFAAIPLQVKDRCIVGRYEAESASLLVKRHTWGGPWRTLRMVFREPAARSCLRLGLYLHDHGIPTPRPRAYVEHRLGPWAYRSYLISDYAEGTSLYRYIRFGSQSADELWHVARQVAEIWQRLVELNVSHNDFKPENFIVDDERRVWLIDLEKVRIGGKPSDQQRRHVFDANNFLHIRNWHRRGEARAIFAQALLATPASEPLQASAVRGIADNAVCPSEIDAELSAVIVCESGVDLALARHAIDSVKDIADEAVLVEALDSGELDVIKRIELCRPAQKSHSSFSPVPKCTARQIARYPWVLVLSQNECVTPFLAKELQQKIVAAEAPDAFQIPIEEQFFGRTVSCRQEQTQSPRLFRQGAKPIVSLNGLEPGSEMGRREWLTGFIQRNVCPSVASFIEALNHETTAAAAARRRQGERPRLVRAGLRAGRQFVQDYLLKGGFRNGWTGLQMCGLKAFFGWLEEAKLQQLSAEFADIEPAAERSLPERAASSAPVAGTCAQSNAA